MSLQEQGHRPSIKNVIERIKGYRPPPLKIILNGPPNDIASNTERLAIAGAATIISIALINSPLHIIDLGFSALFAIYGGEMTRQMVLHKFKSTKSKK